MIIVAFTVSPQRPPPKVDLAAAFHEHGAFLFRNVLRWVQNPDEADDIVQDVFLIANRKQHELDDDTHLRAWLYKTAQNVVKHHRRSYARRRRLADAASEEAPSFDDNKLDADEVIRAKRNKDLVRRCAGKLAASQRDVFILFELEDLSGPEIAELLDISENAVWTRLLRARKRFAVLLQQEMQDDVPHREAG